MNTAQLPSLVWIVVLSLIPLLLLSATSFVKVSIVFSLLRNGLGTNDVPSGAVVTALAVVLSVLIMTPVTQKVMESSAPLLKDLQNPTKSSSESVGQSAAFLFRFLDTCKEPWRQFLTANTGAKEKKLFVELANKKVNTVTIASDDFRVLLPSFLVTELSEALQVGFVVLLPFLMVDLIVVNLLTALGMYSISASVVALPLKLLLFLALDGWMILSKALVQSYH